MIAEPVSLPQMKAWQRPTKKSFLSRIGLPPRFSVPVLLGIAFVPFIFGAIITLRTKEGTLTVEMSETDVNVEIFSEDGKLEIERKGDKKMVISIDPGKHRLRLTRDGSEVFVKEFAIASGGKEVISAKFVPSITDLSATKVSEGVKSQGDLVETSSAASVKSMQQDTSENMKELSVADRGREDLAEVKINYQIAAPDVVVLIDGNEYIPDELADVIRMQPGSHKLVVNSLGVEIQSVTFNLEAGKRKVLNLKPRIAATFVEEFDGNNVEDTGNDLVKAGVKNGVLYYDSQALGNGWLEWGRNNYSEGIIEVTARVGEECKNAWIVDLPNTEHKHGVAIAIFGDGRALLGPSMFDPEPSAGPTQKWINHKAIKPAGEWNTLRLVIKGKTLAVYCNSQEIVSAIDLDFELSPGGLLLGYSMDNGKARVEFDRYCLWPTTDISLLPEPPQNANR